MAEAVTIAVDAMGGDTGAQICVPASLQLVRRRPGVRIILVGQREVIEPIVASLGGLPPGVEIVDARQVVAMDEPPAESLRKKKDSSMRIAIDLVRDGRANACVSAGNTGALMATGRFVLKTLPGIDRPAIMALLPTRHGAIYMLDLGANADCTAEHCSSSQSWVRLLPVLRSPSTGLASVCSISGRKTSRVTRSSSGQQGCSQPACSTTLALSKPMRFRTTVLT